jgi:hypothetical protein
MDLWRNRAEKQKQRDAPENAHFHRRDLFSCILPSGSK